MFKRFIAPAAIVLAACAPAFASLDAACALVYEHTWAAAEARDRGETMEEHIATYTARPWIEAYESQSIIETAQVAYGAGAGFDPEQLANEARTACRINGAAMGY